MDKYDLEMTYRLCSHAITHYFDFTHETVRTKLFAKPKPFEEKKDAVAYVNSNCQTVSGRDAMISVRPCGTIYCRGQRCTRSVVTSRHLCTGLPDGSVALRLFLGSWECLWQVDNTACFCYKDPGLLCSPHAQALMETGKIPVHSYGQCLRNMENHTRTFNKVELFSSYKFCVVSFVGAFATSFLR